MDRFRVRTAHSLDAGLAAVHCPWSPDQVTWELYDLSSDFSQATDLAAQNPAKVAELKQAFAVEAKANRVDPVGGGLWSILHPQYAPSNPAKEFSYNQDMVGIPEFAGPKVGARSSLVTMDVDLTADSSGVVYALGAVSGGLALWVDKGKLSYEYNLFEIKRTLIESQSPLPTGKVKVEVESRVAGPRQAMDVQIRVNGQEVAKGQVPMTAALAFTANDAFDIGMDSYSPVSLVYFDRAPFFNGRIGQVVIRYL